MMIQNPVLTGFNPDPSICRVGDDYYIAVSTFEWFPGVQIHHSKDLKNWHVVSQPLNRVSQLNMIGNPDSGGVWAPCLSYADGRFWLIYSDVKVAEGDVWKDVNNYLVTCDTIDGEWSDPVYLNSAGFDPSLFHDEDGKKYVLNMVWDHRVQNHRFYGITVQEYDHEAQKLIGKPSLVFKGTDIGLTEAPHVYKKNGWYYLLTAEGGTKFEHAATIARSRSLFGPYEVHPDNPLLTSWHDLRNPLQKSGHASFVETPEGDWYLAHLMGRPLKRPGKKVLEERGYCPLGRETSIQKLEWREDWPYVVGGPAPSVEVEAPNVPEVTWEQEPVRDDFDADKLSMAFQTLRIPFTEEIGSLTDRPGYLRLYGRESLHSQFTQAHVARRWQHFSFQAETKLSFEPETFQQMAGVTCYYNIRNWVFVHVTNHEEKGRIIDVMMCDQFQASRPIDGAEIQVPEQAEHVWIRVHVDGLTYQFSYSFDGETWETIPVVFDSWKLSDDYVNQGGFFTGAFVGMCNIDMTGGRTPADFDYFDYAPVVEA